ncbi:hypothetical protein C6497_05260 [Candidatus Poribacteria bacterium]|nr:MAG: hypothetical protein C6497_05260 [Candidatus Poribacteria bacterium]
MNQETPYYFLILLIFISPLTVLAEPYFLDVTKEMNLDFHHINGFSDERRLVQTMGSGGTLFDSDNDGDWNFTFTIPFTIQQR